MAVKRQTKDKSITEYLLNIWEKERILVHITMDGADVLLIPNNFDHICPKCSTSYCEPKHGDRIVCTCCFAKFQFHGACHPEPIEGTRREVENIAHKQGILI